MCAVPYQLACFGCDFFRASEGSVHTFVYMMGSCDSGLDIGKLYVLEIISASWIAVIFRSCPFDKFTAHLLIVAEECKVSLAPR